MCYKIYMLMVVLGEVIRLDEAMRGRPSWHLYGKMKTQDSMPVNSPSDILHHIKMYVALPRG